MTHGTDEDKRNVRSADRDVAEDMATARELQVERSTKETEIRLKLNLDNDRSLAIETGVPFFDHMLHAMAFHGGFGFELQARGDIEVDPHHLVEDVGIVFGTALAKAVSEYGPVARYGHAIIPMDDALSEATIDAGNRPYLVYRAEYPQPYCGQFAVELLREFFHGLAMNAAINLHLEVRYGENTHHMCEALMKALGRALAQAYRRHDRVRSTKGSL